MINNHGICKLKNEHWCGCKKSVRLAIDIDDSTRRCITDIKLECMIIIVFFVWLVKIVVLSSHGLLILFMVTTHSLKLSRLILDVTISRKWLSLGNVSMSGLV